MKTALGTENVTNFTEDQLNSIITRKNTKINRELNVQIVRERIEYINITKKNIKDGSNTTFYVRNWFGKFYGDSNDDGAVTIADIEVISRATGGTETELTVSSIDNDNMGFTLSTAPESNVSLYVTYYYSYYDMQTPDQNIKDLARYLCLSEAFFDIEIDLIGTSAKSGNISVAGLDKNTKTHKYKNKADELLSNLKSFGSSKRTPRTFNVAKRRRYRRERYLSTPNYGEHNSEKDYPYAYPYQYKSGDTYY